MESHVNWSACYLLHPKVTEASFIMLANVALTICCYFSRLSLYRLEEWEESVSDSSSRVCLHRGQRLRPRHLCRYDFHKRAAAFAKMFHLKLQTVQSMSPLMSTQLSCATYRELAECSIIEQTWRWTGKRNEEYNHKQCFYSLHSFGTTFKIIPNQAALLKHVLLVCV